MAFHIAADASGAAASDTEFIKMPDPRSWTNWPQTFRDKLRPDNLRSLHKFRKVI